MIEHINRKTIIILTECHFKKSCLSDFMSFLRKSEKFKLSLETHVFAPLAHGEPSNSFFSRLISYILVHKQYFFNLKH